MGGVKVLVEMDKQAIKDGKDSGAKLGDPCCDKIRKDH